MLYFESKNELKFYNLEARTQMSNSEPNGSLVYLTQKIVNLKM